MKQKKISGNETVIRRFATLLKAGRLAHAYILIGPRSVGKYETALEVAKLVNCEGDAKDVFCDTCPSCLKIDHLHHPDVLLVEPQEQWIRIDQIRDLQRELSHNIPRWGKSK